MTANSAAAARASVMRWFILPPFFFRQVYPLFPLYPWILVFLPAPCDYNLIRILFFIASCSLFFFFFTVFPYYCNALAMIAMSGHTFYCAHTVSPVHTDG